LSGLNHIDLINRIKKKIHGLNNIRNMDGNNENKITRKWVSFTYVGTEMLSITKLLKT
jgi:hypothetical protein